MKNRFRALPESSKLAMLQMKIEEIYDAGYDACQFDKSMEKVAELKPKTSNQCRAELIQRAREFVEEHERDLPGRWDCRDYGNRTCRSQLYETEFVVKGGNVTALVFSIYGIEDRFRRSNKPKLIGRAKCAPGDVFNEWIGKAIALARALDIEVPAEFLEAVQPSEIAEGVMYSLGHPRTYYTGKKDTHRFGFAKEAVILDDTNAQYEDKP